MLVGHPDGTNARASSWGACFADAGSSWLPSIGPICSEVRSGTLSHADPRVGRRHHLDPASAQSPCTTSPGLRLHIRADVHVMPASWRVRKRNPNSDLCARLVVLSLRPGMPPCRLSESDSRGASIFTTKRASPAAAPSPVASHFSPLGTNLAGR